MTKDQSKLLKPGDIVFPVKGHFHGKKCEVVQVQLGDEAIGNVWVKVIIKATGTTALFGGEELTQEMSIQKPKEINPSQEGKKPKKKGYMGAKWLAKMKRKGKK